MTKQDAAWLGIRSLGIVTSLLTLSQLIELRYVLYFFLFGAAPDAQEQFGSAFSWTEVIPHLFWVLILLSLSLYLLRKGTALNRVLCWVPSDTEASGGERQ